MKQSGDAGAGQAQANRLNVAHWNGLCRNARAAGGRAARGRAAHGRAAHGRAAHGRSGRRAAGGLGRRGPPNLRRARAGRADARAGNAQGPCDHTARPPDAGTAGACRGSLLPRVTTLVRRPGGGGVRELAPARAGRAALDADATTAVGTSNYRSLVCPTCGSSSLFGAIEGAHTTGSAGVVAALSRFRLFAPSGAGRVRHDTPALGLPVEITALERPG